jgi:phosphoribosyl-ATP pyrophosphohydrolase
MVDEKIIHELYETLKNRRDSPINSYTSNIMQNTDKLAEDKILEKIGEETAEVLIASKNNENLVHESADLIFHTLLLLVYKEIELDDLLNEFKKRMK